MVVLSTCTLFHPLWQCRLGHESRNAPLGPLRPPCRAAVTFRNVSLCCVMMRLCVALHRAYDFTVRPPVPGQQSDQSGGGVTFSRSVSQSVGRPVSHGRQQPASVQVTHTQANTSYTHTSKHTIHIRVHALYTYTRARTHKHARAHTDHAITLSLPYPTTSEQASPILRSYTAS
jgi:hypothetical protein